MNQPKTKRCGFTLIELLTVIGIIALLAALLFPVIRKAIAKAEITQARGDMKNIEHAIKAYLTEYGVLPYCSGTADIFVSVPDNHDVIKSLMVNNGTLASQNPRGIPFLQAPSRKNAINASYIFTDPWNKAYKIWLDCDYSNVISVNSTNRYTFTVISSYGPDQAADTGDDIYSYE